MKLHNPFIVAISSNSPVLFVLTILTCIGIIIGTLALVGPSIFFGVVFLVAVARVLFATWYGY